MQINSLSTDRQRKGDQGIGVMTEAIADLFPPFETLWANNGEPLWFGCQPQSEKTE